MSSTESKLSTATTNQNGLKYKLSHKTRNNNSNAIGCICITILVIIVFICGVFIGSKVVHDEVNHPLQSSSLFFGIRGTLSNDLTKWDTTTTTNGLAKALNLRKVDNKDSSSKDEKKESTPAFDSSLSGREDSSSSSIAVAVTENIDHERMNAPNIDTALYANLDSYMIAPNNLDDDDILITTWVYLNELSNNNDMRTIFSNKKPGCEVNTAQYGLSMFVNNWQDGDRRLYVEYGTLISGCSKIDSKEMILGDEKWYHVAVHFSIHTIALYIDGVLVNSIDASENDIHQKQVDNSMFIGIYDSNGQWPLDGYISNFVIIHNVESLDKGVDVLVNELSNMMSLFDITAIAYAYYPLNIKIDRLKAKEIDSSSSSPIVAATDMINGNNGEYTALLPLLSSASSFNGVQIKLVDGLDKDHIITEAMKIESDRLGRERRENIKDGMKHAWEGYRRYAWGRDELKPLSNNGVDNWGGMGVTLVDSLDTLWLMGMEDEYNEAKEWIENDLSFDHAGTVSVFETTIRELGGLLAAYDIAYDKIYLEKAKQLGDKLLPAFHTYSGIPTSHVNFETGRQEEGWSGSSAILSELGSLQLEFRYLSYHTGDQKYEDIVMKPMKLMYHRRPKHGLFPIKVSNQDGSFVDSQITFGALGDSFYEYLLKIWLQGNRKENWLREMYDNAMDGMIDKLLLKSSISGLAFLSDWNGRYNNRKMDHLVCFVPGMLALGAYTNLDGIDSIRSKRDLAVAKALMYTCYQMYHRMPSGISAEYVLFPTEKVDFYPGNDVAFYILRPETVESLFILNKLTGDPIYREWGWEIWQSINKHCKTKTGYGAIRNVRVEDGGGIDDRMESFFLAETMKYLYLGQDPDAKIDLMKQVFNTEAHPMGVFDDNKHIPIVIE